MNFRTFTTRQALATLGACFALLLLTSPASAVPDGFQPQLSGEASDAFSRYLANHRGHEEQAYHATRIGIRDSVATAVEQAAAEPPVISYLSHGVLEPEQALEVIPYLSHGTLDEAQAIRASGVEQPDGFQPQLRGVESVRVADSGFDWETTSVVAGGILAAMLLALMSTIALRERRGLRGA